MHHERENDKSKLYDRNEQEWPQKDTIPPNTTVLRIHENMTRPVWRRRPEIYARIMKSRTVSITRKYTIGNQIGPPVRTVVTRRSAAWGNVDDLHDIEMNR